ncbi:MAG: exopolyphosphatase [Negativicutes bacterium]|nr:exopolyphosphatase [Negativicutes bacterium]
MVQNDKRYRLLTRANFDGLVSAFILRELDMLSEVKFVHPNDIKENRVAVTDRDISAGLPYHPGIYLAFDNHSSEAMRIAAKKANHIINPKSSSTARLIYEYFGNGERLPQISSDMLAAVDKTLSANYTLPEILNPQGWVLLNFLLDPRTGFSRFRNFRISNYQLMQNLIDSDMRGNIDEILNCSDVRERVAFYNQHAEPFRAQLRRCTVVRGNLAISDFRSEETLLVGNRFVLYAIYPECNLSIRILNGQTRETTVITLGKSNFNRSSRINAGGLMLKFGGDGHFNAGACTVTSSEADRVVDQLIGCLLENGRSEGCSGLSS